MSAAIASAVAADRSATAVATSSDSTATVTHAAGAAAPAITLPSTSTSAAAATAAAPTYPATRRALKGEDAWKRMNFLYQSSHLVQSSLSDSLAGSNLARFYAANLKKIAAKLVMRIDPSVKNSMCKRCGSLLIPGRTAELRVLSAGAAEAFVKELKRERPTALGHTPAADVEMAPAVVTAVPMDTAADASTAAASSLPQPPPSADAPSRTKSRRRRHRTTGSATSRSSAVHIVSVCGTCSTRKRVHTKQTPKEIAQEG